MDGDIYISGFPWPLSSICTPQRAGSIPHAWALWGITPRKAGGGSSTEGTLPQLCFLTGPSGLPNGKCCPCTKPRLRQAHCLLNYRGQKRQACQVSLCDCHPYQCQPLVRSVGSSGESRELSTATTAVIGLHLSEFSLRQRCLPSAFISDRSPVSCPY